MEKRYRPADIEQRLYRAWEKSGAFRCGREGEPYCIMLPPPNVTGTLHMGHAFQVSLMDCLIRYHRMRGKNVLWQPGTDHAGIATQMLIERKLHAQNTSRAEIGREQFIEEVWAWKEQSGNSICKQLRRLGASLDWERERFTMDEDLSAAVRHAFIELYRDGLIFRGQRLVNWDPALKTAVSDLEVVVKEEQGRLWHIRYPISGGDGYVVVATTRPETMFGDTAVAAHPEDERYRKLIGGRVELPFSGRTIAIIGDEHVDPEFGSGCVKVTPAHDFNDYRIGMRHRLESINIFNPDASLNDAVPPDYRRLDRYVARDKLLKQLRETGLLEREEEHTHSVPYGDRSNSVIEPLLTDQWFVDAKALAQPAIEAANDGRIRFIPQHWTKTYLEWMNNIQDWCISRQIWWGHRIPAWYDEDGNIYVGASEAAVREENGLAPDVPLTQDEDVLDTWFSSSLWPFSALGWPRDTDALKTFYPTAALVTGFDIIFFWAARMIMMGLKLTGEAPFREVCIHGLIRDAEGQKMSKSKGNVLDPLDLIDGIGARELVEKHTANLMQPEMAERIKKHTLKHFPDGIQDFGCDALRFTFIAMASTGRDIRFDIGRIEGYRNFCNKLWNATRFITMLCGERPSAETASSLLPDRWIRARIAYAAALEPLAFDLLANEIYQFVWHDFCDGYLEYVKLIQNGDVADNDKQACRANMIAVMETVLRLLHPIIPYVSEELWQMLKPLTGQQEQWLQQRPWPQTDAAWDAPDALETMERIRAYTDAIRRLRSETEIPPSTPVTLCLKQWQEDDRQLFQQHGEMITALTRVAEIKWLADDEAEPVSTARLVGNAKVLIPLAARPQDSPQARQEARARLIKEVARINGLLKKLHSELGNENFINKAPERVVAKKREQADSFARQLGKYQEQIVTLETAQDS